MSIDYRCLPDDELVMKLRSSHACGEAWRRIQHREKVLHNPELKAGLGSWVIDMETSLEKLREAVLGA
jgi:hypothetical protein